LRFVPWPLIDPLYAAVVQCVEEAVINALVAAPEMVGVDGRRIPRLPHHVVTEAFGAGPEPDGPGLPM
jgi:D-aminopeptidase